MLVSWRNWNRRRDSDERSVDRVDGLNSHDGGMDIDTSKNNLLIEES